MNGEHPQFPAEPSDRDAPKGPSEEIGPAEVDTTLPEPVLLNCWKHHAREVRRRIHDHIGRGAAGLADLPERLLLMGGRISDLYVGDLLPNVVAGEIIDRLRGQQRLEPDAFHGWVEQQAGYGMIEISDGSRWCLRWGTVQGRHVHIHPGRYSPLTIRVRASLLKTAAATLALAELEGRDPLSLNVVNDARERILHLGPVQAVFPGEGLGVVLRTMLKVPQ